MAGEAPTARRDAGVGGGGGGGGEAPAAWRREVLRSAVGATALAVIAVTVVTAAMRTGAHLAFALAVGAISALGLAVSALRPRWPHAVRAAIVVAASFGTAVGTIAVSGYAPGPIVLGIWCALAAGLLFGTRAMYAIGASLVAVILVIGLLQPYYEVVVLTEDFAPGGAAAWGRVALVSATVIAAMSVALRAAVSTLERSLREQEQAIRATGDAFAAELRARAERVETERALQDAQKLGTIARLAAGLAHELNNALTVVKLSSARLRRSLARQGATAELVQDASDAWRRASAATRQLLAFSRRDSDAVHLVDAGHVVRESERALANALPEDTHLHIEVPCRAPILADEGRLRQVLLNLIVHARDAVAPGGNVFVRVGVEHGIEPLGPAGEVLPRGSYATMTVAGRGAAGAAKPSLDAELELDGDNLLLFTTLGIVRNASGTIRANGAGDERSELIVYWPLAAEAPPAAIEPAPGEEPASPTRAPTEPPRAASTPTAPLRSTDAAVTAVDALAGWRDATLSRVARVLLPLYGIALLVVVVRHPVAAPRGGTVLGVCMLLLGVPLLWSAMPRRARACSVLGGTVGVLALLPVSGGIPPAALALGSLGVALAAGLWGLRGFALAALVPLVALVVAAAGVVPAPSKPVLVLFEPTALAVWVRIAVMVALALLVLRALVLRTLASLEQAAVDRHRALEGLALQRAASAAEQSAHLQAARALAAADREDTVGRLAGSVAHDVNNALTVIGAWLSRLEEPSPSAARLAEGLDAIDQAVGQAVSVTRQLVFDSAQLPMRAHYCGLRDTVQRLARTLTEALPARISLEVDAATDVAVLVDPAAVRQALFNLALNARDAMPEGGVLTLRVATTPDGQRAVVEVGDDGVGMTDEVAARAFEPFFTTKEPGRGTGLGLASVRRIVEGSGGEVELESQLGAGTRVRLSWPAVAPQPSAREPIAPAARLDVTGARILLAEDEALVRSGMVEALREAGCDVVEAGDGDEAARLLAEWQGELDLLCVDGIMPGVPTADLITRCQQRFPAAAVLICSGHVPEELARRALPGGAVDLLLKPFAPDRLLAAVSDVLVRAGRIRSEAG